VAISAAVTVLQGAFTGSFADSVLHLWGGLDLRTLCASGASRGTDLVERLPHAERDDVRQPSLAMATVSVLLITQAVLVGGCGPAQARSGRSGSAPTADPSNSRGENPTTMHTIRPRQTRTQIRVEEGVERVV